MQLQQLMYTRWLLTAVIVVVLAIVTVSVHLPSSCLQWQHAKSDKPESNLLIKGAIPNWWRRQGADVPYIVPPPPANYTMTEDKEIHGNHLLDAIHQPLPLYKCINYTGLSVTYRRWAGAIQSLRAQTTHQPIDTSDNKSLPLSLWVWRTASALADLPNHNVKSQRKYTQQEHHENTDLCQAESGPDHWAGFTPNGAPADKNVGSPNIWILPPPDCLQAGKRKFQGTNWPGSKKAMEQKGQGAKVPGSELARVLLAPGSELAGSEKARYPIAAWNNFFVLLWGPPFCGAPVWPNMLNMAKSASAWSCGWLPKFNGDFFVQSYIRDKIFTKIRSVFFQKYEPMSGKMPCIAMLKIF